MKRIQSIILLVFFAGFGWSANHGDLTGTNVHTPLKWIWADSAARVAQSIKNVDTMKVGFQKSDSTLWMLADSPAVWTWIGGQYARLDSATVPVIRGLNTMRGNPDFDSVNVSVLAIIDTARVTKGLSVGGKFYGDTLIGPVTLDSMRIGGGDWLGKIVVDTGTTGAAGSKASIALPSGLTKDNCVVLSFGIKYNTASPGWVYCDDFNAGTSKFSVIFSGAVDEYSIVYPNVAQYNDEPYRVVFMKISK
jgi:hypothetical protein